GARPNGRNAGDEFCGRAEMSEHGDEYAAFMAANTKLVKREAMSGLDAKAREVALEVWHTVGARPIEAVQEIIYAAMREAVEAERDWLIKAACVLCRNSYSQRQGRDYYISNFG